MEIIKKVLKNWGYTNINIIERYHSETDRIICLVETKPRRVVIKGIPITTNETTVIGNIKSHEYLGNQKNLAPQIIYLTDGSSYMKDDRYYFYVMEYIEGRQLRETVEDEYILGQASAKLHELNDYEHACSIDSEEQLKIYHEWFQERSFKDEYDKILDSLPNYKTQSQCFIHTDIGPHNAMLNEDGKVIFIDLDDSGIGPRYIDLGWPFIMQFVEFNKETHNMHYRFDLAKAFLHGYYGDKIITKEEIDLIWYGAIYMHISYMKCYGSDAEESLWKILKFGMEQKDKLFHML